MNNTPRTDLLKLIGVLSERYPDWRLGQLIANVAGWVDEEIWDVEDEQLLQAIRAHLGPSAAKEATASQLAKRGA